MRFETLFVSPPDRRLPPGDRSDRSSSTESAGQDIDVEILEDAIAYGYVLLREQPEAASFSGIELWQGKFLKYSDGYHYEDAGYAAPISSPIQADGVTMSLN